MTLYRQLILFGRYPVPGRTKTRLIPALGPLGAADLQRRMTEHCLDTILACNLPAGVAFYYTGGHRERVHRWLGKYGLDLKPQKGKDLGERMQSAAQCALEGKYRQVVMVGTDLPALSAHHLQTAFDALQDHDLVIGPSRDGGYWLIGMSRPAAVFDSIDWGSSRVFAQTMGAARRLGLKTALLPVLNDIDTAADLEAWQPGGLWQRPYLSVIIPALNEAESIGRTIEAARSPDCEIIVADGGSTDETVVLARAAGATVICAPRSRARQQNAAALAARGRVLLFLHADTRLPHNYGAQIFETLLSSRTIAGAFRFKTDYHHPGMRLIEKAVHFRATLLQMPYGDQALFLPAAVFAHAGGFPDVAIAEDLVLVRRLTQLGRIGMAPAAAVTSGRRWKAIGIWRTTLVNSTIAAAVLFGVDPGRLAPLYRLWVKKEKN